MAFSFDLALHRETRRMKRRSKVIRKTQRDSNICNSHKPPQEMMPFDLVIEILTKLPSKSLLRFKSVSNLWLSLICSNYFTNRILKVSSSSPRLYMWLRFDNKKKLLLSSSSSPDLDVSTMASFVVDQDLKIPAMEGYGVSQVYRGLMCFTNGQSAKIYNTTTRQLVVLPDIEESNIIAEDVTFKDFMYGIGHSPVHDQYKVVCIISAREKDFISLIPKFLLEHWVFILGEGVSSRWRKISSPCPPHVLLRQRLSINGRIYHAALESLKYHVLVSFDISSGETRFLQKPEDARWHGYYVNLIEYAGKLAIFGHYHLPQKGVMKLWIMEDEEKNIWSRKELVLHPSQRNMVKKNNADGTDYYLRVRGTTRNGDVILAPGNYIRKVIHGRICVLPTSLFYVLLYNIEKNHLRKVELEDASNCFLNNRCSIIGLDDTENLMRL